MSIAFDARVKTLERTVKQLQEASERREAEQRKAFDELAATVAKLVKARATKDAASK